MPTGHSVRSGPPPDPNALYGNKAMGEWIDLPPEGRSGPPPPWPLDGMTVREGVLWATEWRRPQAVMWERNDQVLEVALYVRSLTIAEQPDAATPARALIRQQMEALGISIPGMQRNRWRIPSNVPTVEPATKGGAPRPSVRDRLKVVGDGRS